MLDFLGQITRMDEVPRISLFPLRGDVVEYQHQLALAYYKLLTKLDWDDELFLAGTREGLNKFLSNAYITYLLRGRNKYHKTQLVSERALAKMEAGDYTGLVFEHLVPKAHYIQEECEKHAKEHTLTVEFVENLLKRYWHLATVTKDEDSLLNRNAMPEDWDGEDVQARYKRVGIELRENPFFSFTKP